MDTWQISVKGGKLYYVSAINIFNAILYFEEKTSIKREEIIAVIHKPGMVIISKS